MPDVTISVRGEARLTIAADYLTLQCWLTASGAGKADALARVRASQQRLTGALTDLGGDVLTVATQGSALTWSVGSVTTHDEHDFDKATGQHGATGRVVANAGVTITVRDLSSVNAVGDELASIEGLHINSVDWHVDRDNAAWRVVRADAIAAAMDKGRDYAAALGGTVTSVEHIADAGLLGGADSSFRASSLMHAPAAARGMGGPADVPSLDPVPQDIYAVVEARLVASVPGAVVPTA